MVDHRAVDASLRALRVGDAFGQTWFHPVGDLCARRIAPGPWPWTDDTAMAAALVRSLRRCGRVDQDD
ncbi:ADP-ribosylglycohydrolase family protein, partial [Actinosynnema sp. NPDC023658]|uniref:ADP-ribosylglycohydrolase family protein n=1 Tax=Actinosynnema sp. NPDC023658 TaxID=3155465 RepID=UPI0033E2FE74